MSEHYRLASLCHELCRSDVLHLDSDADVCWPCHSSDDVNFWPPFDYPAARSDWCFKLCVEIQAMQYRGLPFHWPNIRLDCRLPLS